jgi:hypothetical protein
MLVAFPQAVLSKPQNMFFDLDFTLKSDDNVNQAKLDTDSVEELISEGQLMAGYQLPISQMIALTLSSGLKVEQFQEVASQNSQSALLNAALLWQNSIAYRAPVYNFSVNYEIHNNDSKQQDSTIINSQLAISSRLTDIITGTFGLGHKFRDSESTVYDLEDYRAFLSGDYMLNKQLSIYSTLSFIQGETFSVIRPDSYQETVIALTTGIENLQWDEAYNEEFPSQTQDWISYKLDADTMVFSLGLNFGFGHGNAFDLSYTYADVSGDGGADYERNIFSGSLLKRF